MPVIVETFCAVPVGKACRRNRATAAPSNFPNLEFFTSSIGIPFVVLSETPRGPASDEPGEELKGGEKTSPVNLEVSINMAAPHSIHTRKHFAALARGSRMKEPVDPSRPMRREDRNGSTACGRDPQDIAAVGGGYGQRIHD